MPRVYVIPTPSPNAFATGRNPSMRRWRPPRASLRLLDERELEGVIAHELAHVKHRDILISSVAATIAAAIMMVARMAQFAAFFGGMGGRDNDREGTNPIGLLLTMILAPLAAMLIQAAISRSREFAADAGGAAIAGNPYGLVDALRKIEGPSKRCRSTPIRRPRTCSSSSRSRPAASSACSARIPPTERRIQALMQLR